MANKDKLSIDVDIVVEDMGEGGAAVATARVKELEGSGAAKFTGAEARSSSLSYTPGIKGRQHGEASQQRHCHRDNGSEGSTDMGFELVGLVNSREIICTVIMPTALLESCCYRDLLSHNHSLIKIAKEIFDDLFCNPIRTPWSEGKGIVISGDSCYGNPIKINIICIFKDKIHYKIFLLTKITLV